LGKKNASNWVNTFRQNRHWKKHGYRTFLNKKWKNCSHHLSSNIFNKVNKCGNRCMFGKHVFLNTANFGIEGFRKMFEMTRLWLWTCMQPI
jgi:hypothetical protein